LVGGESRHPRTNMILEIKKYPDPVLKKRTEKVKEITSEIKELIFNMKETLTAEQGAGLAAPQVNVSKKVIIINTQHGQTAFINPQITSKSLKKTKDKEGCLSFPGLWLDIKRSKEIKVKALNENGKEISLKAKDFSARVFQHEIDHLNGILFIERLGFFQKIKVKQDLNKS